jgi:hypothetical protein
MARFGLLVIKRCRPIPFPSGRSINSVQLDPGIAGVETQK